MITKKICLLGAVSVGKTSLVRRFVWGVFSDRYLTTVGVKIDKKKLEHDGEDVQLMIWDLAGEDEFTRLRSAYLKGAAGFFLVVDGTRRLTLEKALELQQTAAETAGDVPFIILFNKADLTEEWSIQESDLEECRSKGWLFEMTSAKNGDKVEEAFQTLTAKMLES